MNRTGRVTLVIAATAGLVAGVILTMTITTPTTDAAGNTNAKAPSADGTTTTTPPAATTAPIDASDTLLVWTSGGLPSGLPELVAQIEGIEELTTVGGDQTDLISSTSATGTTVDQVADGWAIPLDTIAIEPTSFSRFVEPDVRPIVQGLVPGQALLTETSATLRQLTTGATIELRGGAVQIAGVIDDTSGAGAELIVPAEDGPRLGVDTPRYLLLRHTPGTRTPVTEAIAGYAGNRSIRFRSPVETTWLRHGDAVTPPVYIKQAFGEFTYRDRPGRDVEIDPTWIADHIIDADVPILGRVRCHRDAIPRLTRALQALADENLGHLVDPGSYAGCWSPRRIEPNQPLSRHAWGIAVDLNINGNPRGSFSTQDPRLVATMTNAGFTWGGLWLVPDPGHYELVPH